MGGIKARKRNMGKRVRRSAGCLILIFALLQLGPTNGAHAKAGTWMTGSSPDGVSRVRIYEKFGSLPLYFVENQGQTDARVAYYVHGRDKTLYFTSQGITLVLSGKTEPPGSPASLASRVSYSNSYHESDLKSFSNVRRWVVQLDFVGANPEVKPVGQEPTTALISYFNGPREQWKTGLKTYASVAYHDLWPGIDLVFTGTVNRLKYRFLVKPGADPGNILLAYRGARSVKVNQTGQLEVETPVGRFQDDVPYAYQEVEGKSLGVATAYSLQAKPGTEANIYGFDLGSYDKSRTLVIDPAVLVYCGYLGGSEIDQGKSIALDRNGNVYIAGWTTSTIGHGFPAAIGPDLTHNGDADAFVAKVNRSGTALLYCGYIGGSDSDLGNGIAVDSDGNAYVLGDTRSSKDEGFPVTDGPLSTHYEPYADVFVAKVNWNGTGLLYCSYIGGNQWENGNAIAVDDEGNAYITGCVESTEATFPVAVGPYLIKSGMRDAFVAKVNWNGTGFLYSGYIGGNGMDCGYDIAVDGSGNAYVTGETDSPQFFPVAVGPHLIHSGGRDAFVAKVNSGGTGLVYSGYIGGSADDTGRSIAVDRLGNAYITGYTDSTVGHGFPAAFGPDLTHNGAGDAFVAKVNSSGSALLYCGYIGGSDFDSGWSIAVDGLGNAYVAGSTSSTEATFPVIEGPDLTHNGSTDAFVAKVYWTGSALVYCGYIGGSNYDTGYGIAVDENANAYVTGYTGSDEASFPVIGGPNSTHKGSSDAFVAKIVWSQESTPAPSVNLPQTGQKTCYDGYDGNTHLGAPVPCPGTGQDGEIQAGVAWPAPRFTDHANGAVTDKVTGLMWLKDGNCITTKYPEFDNDVTSGDGRVTWQHALDFISAINSGTYPNCSAGFTDWHLPNLNQLQSLLHSGLADSVPWLESRGFTNVAASYWTSTTYEFDNDTYEAWWVELDDGTTYHGLKMSAGYRVWPVRIASTNAPAPLWRTGQSKCYDTDGLEISCSNTGQDGDIQAGVAWPVPRFTPMGGTVLDKLTGLIWLKDANCINTHYSAQIPGGLAEWQDALDVIAGINDGTYGLCGQVYTDWRLPNRKELQSLLDYSNYTPALPGGNFFANLDSFYPFSYWTSTSSGYVTDDPNFEYAWYVNLHDGMVDNSPKNWNPRIWPVRGPATSRKAMPWIPLLLLED